MTASPRGSLRSLVQLFNLRRGLDTPAAIDEGIRDGLAISGANLWLLVLAMLIASIGLDVNAPAVVIGAMLISPLMGPIVGIGYGLAMQDRRLIGKAVQTLLVFTGLSLVSSTLYFLASPLSEAGTELLARTRPTLWDVLVAFLGGAAGIIALTRRSFSNVLPGAAIATALMPPLCTAGYSIANAQWTWAAGALYLFTLNGVFIAFATLVLAKLMRLPRPTALPVRSAGASLVIAGITLVALIVPSGLLAWEVVRTQRHMAEIDATIAAAARLSDVVVLQRELHDGGRRVDLVIAGSERPGEMQSHLMAAAERSPLLADTRFEVRSVTGSGVDLQTLRNALQADLGRAVEQHDARLRDERNALQRERALLAERERELLQVAEELRVQHTALVDVQIAQAPAASGARARVMIHLRAQPALARSERERLERWLAVRLPEAEVSVAYLTGTSTAAR